MTMHLGKLLVKEWVKGRGSEGSKQYIIGNQRKGRSWYIEIEIENLAKLCSPTV